MFQSLSQIPIILENYQFNFPKIPNRLKCVICELILKNAKQTSCGCKFCEKCINNYLLNGPKPCPSKEKECDSVMLDINKDINQDNATNKEIGNIEVNCPFISCNYKNVLKNMEEHINNCEFKFREISCDKCGQKLLANIKLNHDQNNCEKRIISSINCDATMNYEDFDSIHLNPDRIKLCINLSSNNNCSVNKKDNPKEHLKNDTVTSLKDKKALKINKKIENDKFTELLYNNYYEDLLININKIPNLVIQVDKMKLELEQSRCVINSICRTSRYEWEVKDVYVKLYNLIHYESKACFSNSFYTHEFGYKMRLEFYPCDDSIDKDKYLSVFFVIMKGDFDHLLVWPFRQQITLSIINQESNEENNSIILDPDPSLECYQKPLKEFNIKHGIDHFISITEIFNNTKYYKNDTIFIAISFDLPKRIDSQASFQ